MFFYLRYNKNNEKPEREYDSEQENLYGKKM